MVVPIVLAIMARRNWVEARYGFMERPNVLAILDDCRTKAVEINRNDVTFYIGHETIIPREGRRWIPRWQEAIFAAMARNSVRITDVLKLPHAQVVEPFPYRDAVNAGTVSIITAPAGGAKSVFAADMARVLDEKDKLRILPVLGKGPVQNVIDILYLKSIDMGLVTTDVPEFYKIEYNVAITDRLRYIMKLHNDEIHIIAPTEIETVFDLEGKRIEAPKDVGLYSAKAIFSRLKINATSTPPT